MACQEGQFNAVQQSKSFGINLNAQHVSGMTRFNMACKDGPFDVVKLLK